MSVIKHTAGASAATIFHNHKLHGAMLTISHVFQCFQIPLCKSNLHKKSFAVSGMLAWNQLDGINIVYFKKSVEQKSLKSCAAF